MLLLREWLAVREIKNARHLYNSVLIPDLYHLGSFEQRATRQNRSEFVRANHYLSIQPVLKNTLQ